MRISLSSKSQFLGQESESGSQGGEKYHLPTRPAGQAGPGPWLALLPPPSLRAPLQRTLREPRCDPVFGVAFFSFSVWVNSKFFAVPGRWSASTLRWLMD